MAMDLIVFHFSGGENDGSFDWYELRVNSRDYARELGELLQEVGLFPTMYCEIWFKLPCGVSP